MIYIVCDMNCNNFGNYFEVLGLECELEYDDISYIVKGGSYYSKRHCYRATRLGIKPCASILYSEAIDSLIPEDYMRWKKNRFKVKR